MLEKLSLIIKIFVICVSLALNHLFQPILPSCLSMEDMGMLINQAMRNTNIQSSARVLGGTVVVSEKFISNCLSVFDEAMQQKAQKVQLPLLHFSIQRSLHYVC